MAQHEQLAHACLEVDFLEHFGAGFAFAEPLAYRVGFDCDVVHKLFFVFVRRLCYHRIREGGIALRYYVFSSHSPSYSHSYSHLPHR
jgi:hypothetical protein